MVEFKKYTSIENSFNDEFIQQIKAEGMDKIAYVVQDKVHGANCCFITDGATVTFAKRTAPVEPGEKFYDYEELLERYKERVNDLFCRVKQDHAGLQGLMVYGEMFGGKYPHTEVKNDAKILTIQKGVFYTPVHEFYAFDLFLVCADSKKYLPVNETNRYFETVGFIYAKTIFEGALDECLAYPNAFQSKVSEWLGYPPIDDNICEGIIIRPAQPAYLSNGTRILIKNKNEKFAEKKSVKKRRPALFKEVTYTNELNSLLPMVDDYITENRLNNVISKIGEITMPNDTGKLTGLLSKDVLDDFVKEHSGAYSALEKSEQKIFNRHINQLTTAFIKQIYKR